METRGKCDRPDRIAKDKLSASMNPPRGMTIDRANSADPTLMAKDYFLAESAPRRSAILLGVE